MGDARHPVLVVEDDAVIRESLSWQLRGAGYDPVLAEDGQQGWARLESEPGRFVAVLLDRTMPKMDGMEVLHRIKQHDRLQHLPVIMETARAEKADIVEGLEAGAFYYLTKPFDKKTLLAIVRSAVSDYLRHQELCDQTRRAIDSFSYLVQAVYEFRTLEEGQLLAPWLARCSPDPERIVCGLSELFTNAVEHGNLGITYDEKSALMEAEAWEAEVSRRLELPENRDKKVIVEVDRREDSVRYRIQDQGEGFDWRQYLEFSPDRAFDTHGRGIALARQMSFDLVEYQGAGNDVTAMIRDGV